jgi:threonine/homoserine/homoserine lactone efflux protein
MGSYWLFVVLASLTILSPGPGVVLAVMNAIRYGFTGALGGIIGVACATFVVALISATSLGFILASSAAAFLILKILGALYLIYLGIKLWRAPVVKIDHQKLPQRTNKLRFAEGFLMQLSNPKAIFFFMAIFPQFVDYSTGYWQQALLLVCSYCLLLVMIHMLYALLARSIRSWLSSESGGRLVNRIGGGVFVCFGIGLAFSRP